MLSNRSKAKSPSSRFNAPSPESKMYFYPEKEKLSQHLQFGQCCALDLKVVNINKLPAAGTPSLKIGATKRDCRMRMRLAKNGMVGKSKNRIGAEVF